VDVSVEQALMVSAWLEIAKYPKKKNPAEAGLLTFETC
jgi:hypothetical protein